MMDMRLDKLKHLMVENHLDIIAFIPGPNLRYLTGGVHYVMERPILWFVSLDHPPIAVIPQLEVPLFSKHRIESQILSWTDAQGYEGAFTTAFEILKPQGKTIGVEGMNMRYFEGEILRRFAPSANIVDADNILASLRVVKDADEIASLRKAISISEQALELTLGEARPGNSERKLAHILESHIKELGGEGLSFGTILHSAGNSPLPHCGPLDEPIQGNGEPLLIDFGAVYDGYCADITRVVFLGEPSQEFRDFYEVVRKANEVGRSVAGPGVTAESVDLATRQVLYDAGYQPLTRHRTGHGIGLLAHEWPYIVEGNKQVLEPGMVFTIEPGIYRLGKIGVRIEDDVLITENGAESLTTFPREITVIDY